MTQSHTSGPWNVRTTPRPLDGRVWREIVSEDGLVIGEIFSDGEDVGEPSEVAAASNANLISAAPEMAHALELARCIIAKVIGDYNGILGHIEKVQAKAKGEAA